MAPVRKCRPRGFRLFSTCGAGFFVPRDDL